MLRANGLVTRAVVDDRMAEDAVRGELIAALNRPDAYAVSNFRREAVGRKGGGHISPLGAYDAASDSFLALGVNPAAASWVWMPATTVVRGMWTFDTVENRGYVIASVRWLAVLDREVGAGSGRCERVRRRPREASGRREVDVKPRPPARSA